MLTRTAKHLAGFAFLLCAGVSLGMNTLAAHAATTTDASNSAQDNKRKNTVKLKTTTPRSTSEESTAERDRRLYRECKGRPNAGACLGYAKP